METPVAPWHRLPIKCVKCDSEELVFVAINASGGGHILLELRCQVCETALTAKYGLLGLITFCIKLDLQSKKPAPVVKVLGEDAADVAFLQSLRISLEPETEQEKQQG